jgi:putative transposase
MSIASRAISWAKFWAMGYFVSTVGRDEEMIRAYIKNQGLADE